MLRRGLRVFVSLAVGAVAAVAVVLWPGVVEAHEFVFAGTTVLEPDGMGNRKITLHVGEKALLTVRSPEGNDCRATISSSGASTSIATIKKPNSSGAVLSHNIKIKAVGAGTTTLNVQVVGEGDDCTENSTNPVVICVLPSEEAANRTLNSAARSEARLLATGLKQELSTLHGTTWGILDDFDDGTLAPDDAGMALAGAWYQAYADGFQHGRQVLQNLSNFGTSQLVADDWPECTGPFGLAAGPEGALDRVRGGGGRPRSPDRGGLEKEIESDISAFAKIGVKYQIDFRSTYTLNDFPLPDVSGPTRSEKPADPPAPLRIGYTGAMNFNYMGQTGACFVVGGLADPALGGVRIDLWDGSGMVGTTTASPTSDGLWWAMFDELTAGKTYRATVEYGSGGGGFDTSKIWIPIF